jgi:hypothetical protein
VKTVLIKLLSRARALWQRRRKAVIAFVGAQLLVWVTTGHYDINEELISGLLLAFGVERIPNTQDPVGALIPDLERDYQQPRS